MKNFFLALILISAFSYSQTSGNGLTDIDGNHYDTVIINSQEWMQQNLNVSHYRNGDVIPQITDITQWQNTHTGAWCYMLNQTFNGPQYGKLYNRAAMKDPRGLAPEGFTIPTEANWDELSTFLGGDNIAGGALKMVNRWGSYFGNVATNTSGFGALPNGMRAYEGSFNGFGQFSYLWSSSIYPNSNPIIRFLNNDSASFYEFAISPTENVGCAVRCFKSAALKNAFFDIKSIGVYPNPAVSQINIVAEFDLMNFDYIISDPTGKNISSGKLKNTNLDISALQNGIYFIILHNNDYRKIIKFVKKQQ
jgi:uncharacterized protein (TIGR02145 family)